MNNDLEQFSEEYLKDMQKHMALGMTLGHADVFLIRQLIDLSLAAKQAKPVGYFRQMTCGMYYQLSKSTATMDQIPLYTTPQPAHTEQVIKITQTMLDAAVADYCTTGKYTVENIPYELRRQVEFEAECTFKAMLAAAPKPESE